MKFVKHNIYNFISSYIFFKILVVCFPAQVLAAACCGGGVSQAALISSDHLAQLNTGFTYFETVIDHISGNGVWSPSHDRQSTETLKVDYSYIWNDKFQTGISLPFVRRSRQGQSRSGLGDISVSQGYEILSDWDYNPLRPHGIGYLQIVIPTGNSIQEADDFYKLDSRGRGFWTLGLGALLNKNWFSWDALAQIEVHKSFSKKVNNSNFQGDLKPGYGESLNVGLGYNIRDYRIGAALAFYYEDPIRIQNQLFPDASDEELLQRYASASLSLSYTPPQLEGGLWGFTLTYSDQTLFGDPYNTSLGRSISVLSQRRWDR